ELSKALLLTATFTVTPYAFNYDILLFGWITIKLLERPDSDGWDFGLLLAIWIMPLVTLFMAAGEIGLPVSCLPILGLGGKLFWRLWQQDRQLPVVRSPLAVSA